MIRKLARRRSFEFTVVQRHLATWVIGVLGVVTGISLPASASANQALAQKHACIACHQATAKSLGPPWKDIAAKYGDGKGTAAQLVASMKTGSSGKWGS